MNPEPKVPQVQDGGRGGRESQQWRVGLPRHRGQGPQRLDTCRPHSEPGASAGQSSGTDEHSASQGEGPPLCTAPPNAGQGDRLRGGLG